MAHPSEGAPVSTFGGWKAIVSHVAAVLAGVLFVIAGIWKITDPFSASVRLNQALVPGNFSLALAVLLGIAETFSGILVLVPRFRRWGAILVGFLLIVFVIYIGANYSALAGEECNCFPWVRRAVGPAFFIGDGIMLLLAIAAGVWARKSESVRSAALVLLAIAVFAGVSLGVSATRQSMLKAPALITAGGKKVALRDGRAFIYFFDPECAHCDLAARTMAGYRWTDVRIIAVATVQPQFGAEFLRDTRFPALLSTDLPELRKAFPFTSTPYAIALESGRVKKEFPYFDQSEPGTTLRKLGFVR